MKKSTAIPPHLIERAWEIYHNFTYQLNQCPEGESDKLHFLGGFSAALGVLIGTLDVGIPEGTATASVIAQLINDEIPRYQAEIAALTEKARQRKNLDTFQ